MVCGSQFYPRAVPGAVSGAWLLECTAAFSAFDGPEISLTVSISKLVVVALFLFLRS